MSTERSVFVATDAWSIRRVSQLANLLAPHVAGIKIRPHVGLDQIGPLRFVANKRKPLKIFVDGKFLDDPHSIETMCLDFAAAGAAFLTVHARGGIDMMQAAVDGVSQTHTTIPRYHRDPTKILAVLMQTFETDVHCKHTFGKDRETMVYELASDAVYAGVHGVVCSASDLNVLTSEDRFNHLIKFVPGIRPNGHIDEHDTQVHIATPGEAMSAGADYLVLGRPITNSEDPEGAVILLKELLQPALLDANN